MDFITNFISQLVLGGFVHASVIIIALSQVEHLLGIFVSGRHSTVNTLLKLEQSLEQANMTAVHSSARPAIEGATLGARPFSSRGRKHAGGLPAQLGRDMSEVERARRKSRLGPGIKTQRLAPTEMSMMSQRPFDSDRQTCQGSDRGKQLG